MSPPHPPRTAQPTARATGGALLGPAPLCSQTGKEVGAGSGFTPIRLFLCASVPHRREAGAPRCPAKAWVSGGITAASRI